MSCPLWDVFYQAYEQCPQHTEIEDFQTELGQDFTFKEIKKNNLLTLKYWTGNTIGASVLWDKGYFEELPEQYKNIKHLINDAINKALENILTSIHG